MRLDTDSYNDIEMTSEAFGPGTSKKEMRRSKRRARKSKRKEGKLPRDQKKAARLEKREARKEKRGVRREERKKRRMARRNARKLKMDRNQDGRVTFKDFIPGARKRANKATGQAEWVKENPQTGDIEKIPPRDIKKIPNPSGGPDMIVDAKDILTNNLGVQDGRVVAEYTEDQVEEVDFPDGSTGFVPTPMAEEPGMSKGLKTGLIIGGSVLAAAVIGYFIYRGVKAKKAKAG